MRKPQESHPLTMKSQNVDELTNLLIEVTLQEKVIRPGFHGV
jgi:hypothetical protein